MKIAGFSKESIVDGEGYRYTIFVQGCAHACPGCQNQETWDFNGGTYYDTKMVQKIVDEIAEDPIIDGVTLSGGDPFYQVEDCVDLVERLKKVREDLTIWAYTGFTWEEIQKRPDLMKLAVKCDVIVDGPFILCKRSLDVLFRGSTNQRLIDVRKSLECGKVVEYITE